MDVNRLDRYVFFVVLHETPRFRSERRYLFASYLKWRARRKITINELLCMESRILLMEDETERLAIRNLFARLTGVVMGKYIVEFVALDMLKKHSGVRCGDVSADSFFQIASVEK